MSLWDQFVDAITGGGASEAKASGVEKQLTKFDIRCYRCRKLKTTAITLSHTNRIWLALECECGNAQTVG